jgi:hypothetical protein
MTHLGRCGHCRILLEINAYEGPIAALFFILIALAFTPLASWVRYFLALLLLLRFLIPLLSVPRVSPSA